ncbi:MAG: FG-GAP-like repeat-containing protein [Crocinitomicaceae bacterium]
MKNELLKLISVITLIVASSYLNAQTSTQWGPDGFVKIEEGSGGFSAPLDPGDRFSRDHDQAGDINGDGIIDLVVGARSDDDGAIDAGAAYILFMNNDGTVQNNQKISSTQGGFTDTLLASNFFGYGVAGIGDYDSDGIPDIAVSAPGSANSAFYIIHLNNDGTVKNFVKNSTIIAFGLSAIGDLNNDGRIDLVACDPSSDIGGNNTGAISLIFFDASSQLIPSQTVLINPQSGGFGSGLLAGDEFGGREAAMLGDIDGDGANELAVGAFKSDGGKGAIWILSLDNTNYTVISKLKITEGLNGFTDTLTSGTNPNGSEGANFGHALSKVGDLNGDGVPDLMTGANQQSEGWGYILYLNQDKTVKTFTRINNTDGGFGLTLDAEERFSRSISFLGDLRGDGTVAVNYGGGAGAGSSGILYLLFFKPCNFHQEPGFNDWVGGNILYSNWISSTQTVTDSLTFEQCTLKAFETDAAHITYNVNDGRCICMDSSATLVASTESNSAFSNQCFSGALSVSEAELTDEEHIAVYPNPTSAVLTVKTDYTSFSKKDGIQVFSILGEQVYSASLGSPQTVIDLSQFSPGAYILKATINGKEKTFKVLKK